MNILILGNGFDLAHSLPTQYKDFLAFTQKMEQAIKSVELGNFVGVSNYDKKISNNVQQLIEKYLSDYSLCIDNKCRYSIKKSAENEKLLSIESLELNYYPGITQIDSSLSESLVIIANFKRLLNDNYWLLHFYNASISNKWVDFESEISKICKLIEELVGNLQTGINNESNIILYHMTEIHDLFFYSFISGSEAVVLERTIEGYGDFRQLCQSESAHKKDTSISVRMLFEIRDILLDSLERLTLAFELYLIYVIEVSMFPNTVAKELFKQLDIDNVLSFNYTHTWQQIYKMGQTEYIHGQTRAYVKKDNNIISPLVLGMNDSLKEEDSRQNTSIIKFKKYYQRIRKNADGNYKKWVELLDFENNIRQGHSESCYETYRKLYNKKCTIAFSLKTISTLRNLSLNSNGLKQKAIEDFFNDYYGKGVLSGERGSCVYVFGHSLDVTDKDVLRQFIDYDYIRIVIFYLNEEDLDKKIENLVKIIGRQQLIRRRESKRKTIFFQNIVTGESF